MSFQTSILDKPMAIFATYQKLIDKLVVCAKHAECFFVSSSLRLFVSSSLRLFVSSSLRLFVSSLKRSGSLRSLQFSFLSKVTSARLGVLCCSFVLLSGMAYALPRHELLVDKHDIKRSEPLENLDSSEPKKPNEGNKKANSATKKPCENVKPTKDDIFFAPAGSKFVIVDTKDKKDQKFQIRFKKIELSTNDDYRRAGRCIVHEDYTKYEVALADSDYRFSHGLTHGPLTLPFKLQLSDGNVLASGNIGYFMGYRWRYLTFVLPAFGFNIVKPDNTTSGEQKSVIALTAAFGIAYDLTQSMLEIGSGVQFGVFFGIDHANGYAYSGKPWISMGIGYNFNIKGD